MMNIVNEIEDDMVAQEEFLPRNSKYQEAKRMEDG